MTLKRTLIVASCLAVLLATVAFAQHGPDGPVFMKRMHHGGGGHHTEMLVEHLGLNDSQKATFEKLQAEMNVKVEPLLEQHRQIFEETHEALEAGNADPTELGNQMIAGWELMKQVRAAHQELLTQLSTVLTAEQKTKLEEMKERHHKMRVKMISHPGH
ncbi:MAG TPA: Spy/CpxP family protein refolding chaperone [Thermoanaerobaculia bacterium]|nr:Spy/CpxP family protein refolding chaperone [Thermoanaerobaculia bacterium]